MSEELFADIRSDESKRRGILVAQALYDTLCSATPEGQQIEMHEGMLGVALLTARVLHSISQADPTCREASVDECQELFNYIVDAMQERVSALRFMTPAEYLNPGESNGPEPAT